tara:strand:- start:204 stop:512 length:309 start_codon:yes stop_codon:yes gene_type:complete
MTINYKFKPLKKKYVILIFVFCFNILQAKEDDLNFDFCNDKKLTNKQEFLCNQDRMHKSVIDNPLAFILFYLFSILIIAFFFQLTVRDMKKKIESKKKKDDN